MDRMFEPQHRFSPGHRTPGARPRWPILLCGAMFAVLPVGGEVGREPEPASAAPTGVDENRIEQIQHEIQESEYHVTRQSAVPMAEFGAAWQAPNRAHAIRTYFTEGGIRVVPRLETDRSWEAGLSLVGHGRGGEAIAAEPATRASLEKRIDYRRGGLSEWYVNDATGARA